MRQRAGTVKTRRVGGVVYRRYRSYNSRYDARAVRDNLRKRGHSARIFERSGFQNPYVIYTH
jgi:hypothetical protein